ncbi:membrane protein [Clostridia bacterium]|nr:membrane protein [Clostridia bacterium]
MTGTLINVGGILAGSLIGLLLKRGIPEHISGAILKVQGLVVLIIGLNGVLTAMLYVDPVTGRLHDRGALILLISLVVGCAIGEALKIDDHVNGISDRIERRLGAGSFSKGFVSATLIFVVGAMGIVGALNDGLVGDSNVLITKAIIDGITSIILASSLGFGVIFAAIPVLIYQGSISLLAGVISPYISDDLIRMFSMVGYALVMVLGINFLLHTKIKVANLLPALVIPIIWYYVSAAIAV